MILTSSQSVFTSLDETTSSMKTEAVSPRFRKSALLLMFKAFVLVRNLESAAEGLGLWRVHNPSLVWSSIQRSLESFSSVDVNQDDWIIQKSYSQLPLSPQFLQLVAFRTTSKIFCFFFGFTRLVTYHSSNQAIADSEGWRSAFRTDVDHDSEVMPISVPN